MVVWSGLPGNDLAVAARVMREAPSGRIWLDTNTVGQHLPQMYRPEDTTPLTAETCAIYGLCSECLGYGSEEDAPLAAALDQIPVRCMACGGTGRPSLRVQIERDGSGMVARMQILPHEPIPYEGRESCMACGVPVEGHEDLLAEGIPG